MRIDDAFKAGHIDASELSLSMKDVMHSEFLKNQWISAQGRLAFVVTHILTCYAFFDSM